MRLRPSALRVVMRLRPSALRVVMRLRPSALRVVMRLRPSALRVVMRLRPSALRVVMRLRPSALQVVMRLRPSALRVVMRLILRNGGRAFARRRTLYFSTPVQEFGRKHEKGVHSVLTGIQKMTHRSITGFRLSRSRINKQANIN